MTCLNTHIHSALRECKTSLPAKRGFIFFNSCILVAKFRPPGLHGYEFESNKEKTTLGYIRVFILRSESLQYKIYNISL
jgi:hypothetical protein